jgi:Flp pilus assembly protein TadD
MTLRSALGALIALGLAACEQTGQTQVSAQVDASLRQAAVQAEQTASWPAAVATYRALYDKRPDDPEIAAGLIRALRNSGQTAEALRVGVAAAAKHAGSALVIGEQGKAMLAARDLSNALRTLQTAAALPEADWTIHSAMGIAYDFAGQHESAQAAYARALALSPDNLTVMNNLALSLALSGNLDAAIARLEPQNAMQRTTPQTRQSLALLYALRGDLGRTENLVRRDLPEKLANENLAYYRLLTGLR